jgi:hypothetical protein
VKVQKHLICRNQRHAALGKKKKLFHQTFGTNAGIVKRESVVPGQKVGYHVRGGAEGVDVGGVAGDAAGGRVVGCRCEV